ncbi:hypothetical protein MJO29_011714 [Puccinia striiformis f. sp. tritici]|nr:hypothetical protein MJO29_011714 [Puccinia striiformis f. sp. tritici]
MVERTARRESSEIEVWAARTNDKGVHRSPTRKLMRSPLCWNPVLDITSAQRIPKRIRVTAETVTGKEGSSSIGTTDRSLSDEVQLKNISLLNRISTIENRTTSEYYNQQKQDSSIAHSVARLTFGGSRLASRLPSISPTRKRPGSDRSSNQLVGATSSESTRGTVHQPPIMAPPVLDKPPLNDLGLAMTLDEFIEHCNLGDLASVAHGLIKLNHISHWDFFYRDATAEQLQL